MLKLMAVGLVAALGTVLAADNVTWSITSPGGIDSSNTPMLVGLAFDDNTYADGVNWFLDFTKDLKNKDGSPVRATYFIISGSSETDHLNAPNNQTTTELKNSWIRAYKGGYEIGDHTKYHDPLEDGADSTYWSTAITGCKTELASYGIPADSIIGMRCPYLGYGAGAFEAIKTEGMLYDCSVETGYNWNQIIAGYGFDSSGTWVNVPAIVYSESNAQGSKYQYFPYTYDNGPAPGSTAKTSQPMPGVWELPVQAVRFPATVPTDLSNIPDTDPVSQNPTGLDYNCWKICTTKDEFLNAMKYSFSLHRQGNRSPFYLGMHSDYYSNYNADVNADTSVDHFAVSLADRRAAIEEFITYVLQFNDVRCVPFRDVVRWMQNPQPTGTYVAPAQYGTWDAIPIVNQKANLASAKTTGVSHMTRTNASLNVQHPGTYRIGLLGLDGRQIYSGIQDMGSGSQTVNFGKTLPSGVYMMTINGNGEKVNKAVAVDK